MSLKIEMEVEYQQYRCKPPQRHFQPNCCHINFVLLPPCIDHNQFHKIRNLCFLNKGFLFYPLGDQIRITFLRTLLSEQNIENFKIILNI